MRSHRRPLFGCSLVLFLVASAPGPIRAESSPNLLRGDTSFETGSPGGYFRIGFFEDDYRFRAAGKGIEAAWDGETAVHGKKSLRIAAESGRPGLLFPVEIPQEDPPQDATLTASVYVRGGETGGTARLALLDGRGTLLTEHSQELHPYWQRLNATWTDVSPGSVAIVAEPADGGPVWIDAVQLERGERSSTYRMKFPLTYGVRIPQDETPCATSPLRLTAHVFNDTEYIAVCRIVGDLRPAESGDDVEPVARAEARLGLPPRSGKDATLDFGSVPAGSYLVVVNRAEGPREEEARLPVEIGPGPGLEVVCRIAAAPKNGEIVVTIRNVSGEERICRTNVWLGPSPLVVEPVRTEIPAGERREVRFPIPERGSRAADQYRIRVETALGAVETRIPVAAAPASAEPAEPGTEE